MERIKPAQYISITSLIFALMLLLAVQADVNKGVYQAAYFTEENIKDWIITGDYELFGNKLNVRNALAR